MVSTCQTHNASAKHSVQFATQVDVGPSLVTLSGGVYLIPAQSKVLSRVDGKSTSACSILTGRQLHIGCRNSESVQFLPTVTQIDSPQGVPSKGPRVDTV